MGWEYFLDFEYLAELRHADRVIEGEGGFEYVIPSSCIVQFLVVNLNSVCHRMSQIKLLVVAISQASEGM
jgi:hypothetical protein